MNKPMIPTHLAIIPDGNRRWAKEHGLTGEAIYTHGGEKLTDILQVAFNLGVRCVSLWIGSYDNLSARNPVQIKILKRLYEQKFRELSEHPFIMKNRIKIEVLGEWRELLHPTGVQAVEHAMEITAEHTNGTLAILVGYDGGRERGAALHALATEAGKRTLPIPNDPTKSDKLLRSFAWTGHLPDVDLLIRTGAWEDPHNSAHFLTFLVGNTQYAFPKVLWPDYTVEMLKATIEDYGLREQRHGR